MESAYLPVANASFIEEDILAWRPMKALVFCCFDLNIFLSFFLCDKVIHGCKPIRLIMPYESYMTLTGVH